MYDPLVSSLLGTPKYRRMQICKSCKLRKSLAQSKSIDGPLLPAAAVVPIAADSVVAVAAGGGWE